MAVCSEHRKKKHLKSTSGGQDCTAQQLSPSKGHHYHAVIRIRNSERRGLWRRLLYCNHHSSLHHHLKVSYYTICRHILQVSDVYKYINTCLLSVLFKNTKQIMHFRNPSYPSVPAVRETLTLGRQLQRESRSHQENSPSRNSAKCFRDETAYHVPNHMKDPL